MLREMFFGGLKPEKSDKVESLTELLAQDPNLDGMPSMSGGQYFEDYTFRSYALFWPRDSGHKPQCVEQSDFLESWKEAVLDRESGAIYDPKPRRGHWH